MTIGFAFPVNFVPLVIESRAVLESSNRTKSPKGLRSLSTYHFLKKIFIDFPMETICRAFLFWQMVLLFCQVKLPVGNRTTFKCGNEGHILFIFVY